MSEQLNSSEQKVQKPRTIYQRSTSEAVYAFGMFGAWFYYLTQATTFWMGALGLLKGIFWPALLVYELMKYLHM